MNKIKVLYLGAKLHRFPSIYSKKFEFTYNDIVDYDGIDLVCDMLAVDLTPYDIIIATPPCNYYSRANAYWRTSVVSQKTKHILPDIINKCILSNKLFIVENTYSSRSPIDYSCNIFTYGSHIFYSNIWITSRMLDKYIPQNITYKSYGNRDNNPNVHRVLDLFLDLALLDFLYSKIYE